MTYLELQEGEKISELEVVRKALNNTYEIIDESIEKANFNYKVKSGELEVSIKRKNGIVESLPLRFLSDGIKSTMSMIADIAYRMAILNPQKNSDILTISYTSNGEIKSSNPDYQNDFDNILNLNDTFGLVEARKEALKSLKRKLDKYKTHLTKEKIQNIYARYSEAEIKESYVGILLWYLQRRMR